MASTDVLIKLAVDGASVVGSELNKVNSSMNAMESAVNIAKTALIAFTGISGVGAFKGMIEGALASVDGLHDLSIMTGASVESLSALVAVGKLTGTTGDVIADAMNKLAKNMAVSNEESKGAAQAIAALGLNFADFNALSPDEKMVALAESMAGFADGSDKSAVAMTLLGRSGAHLLPHLKDLAESGSLNAKVTKEQAAQADQFSDDMKRLKASGEAWKKELALGMLPALQETATATLGLVGASGGLRDEMKRLSADGSIAGWTRDAVTGITYVMDAFGYMNKIVGLVATQVAYFVTGFIDGLGTLGTIITKVIKGQYGDAMGEVANYNNRAIERTALLNDTMQETWGEQTLGQRLRARIADVRAIGVVLDGDKDKLDYHAGAIKDNTAALKEQKDAEDKWIATVQGKIGVIQDQLDSTLRQTEADKLQNQLLADLANSVLILTDAQLAARLEAISDLASAEDLLQADKELNQAINELCDAHDKQAQELAKESAAMQDANDKIKEQNLALGIGKEAYGQHLIALMLDQAGQLELQAATSDQSAELLKQAGILRERAGLAQEGIVAKEAKDAATAWAHTTKSIGDGLSSALTDALMNGRSLWDAFKNYLINTILDGAIKNALSSAIQSGLSSLFGSAAGNVAGGGGSVLGGISSAAGGGGSVLGGISSAAGSALGIGAGGFTGTGLTGALGIGASAGAGVTSSAVAGGSAVGVDLGLLGSGGAAAGGAAAGGATSAGASALAGLSWMGPAAAMAAFAAYIWDGGSQSRSLGNTEITVGADGKMGAETGGTDSTRSGAEAVASAWIAMTGGRPGTSHTFSFSEYLNLKNNTTGLSIATDGYSAGAGGPQDFPSILARALGYARDGKPVFEGGGAFANGGDHPGGWRLVGERGPELEYTGPSRIFDANTTASMLRSGGAAGPELLAELKLLREEVRGLRSDARQLEPVQINISNRSASEVSIS